MAGTTPHVEQATLTLGLPGQEQVIAVGSPAWFTWLSTATAFTFTCPEGTFTARRQRASSGRGGWYWRAEQRRAGVRRRAYLGKPEELTLEQLRAVAAKLTRANAPAYIPVSRAVGASAPVDASPVPAALPIGTVTFLFTDIAGSTQLWEQHKEAMQAALARHDLLLRQAIDAHNGAVFKTVGDSVYAAFVRAPDALAAALAAQRALQQEAWELPTPLRVRMALHSGAAELRDGDYFGPPLNRLARLLNLGHGGQILLSRATHDLVVDELPRETSLRDLGEQHLKDLSRPEQIFQLVSRDLSDTFPPLRIDGPRPSSGVPSSQLLATKLYMPRARLDLVARPRLFARLDAGLHGLLTLVCAPAGFGKTTLIAEWLASRTERRGRRTEVDGLSLSPQSSALGTGVAWLSLDAGDSDPVVFLRYLVAALQALAPDVGAALLERLQSPQPPLETLLTVLVNDLAAVPDESILVLDDYHILQAPPIHQAVGFLLDHLPPALHLVIATREDPPLPLARLRARGQVVELRAEQLRFTAGETATFLTELMGLPLSAEDAAALEARTEGWIAGLQLAALAMRDHDDQAGFIATFTGSNRFIVDYLADEVLRSLPSHIQTFLLQTSILERMCGPLCDAVLGLAEDERPKTEDENASSFVVRPSSFVSDAYSQQLLEHLERANLFVMPLDGERRWYRYHHLFAEVVRQRLRSGASASAVQALHQRASAWYERQGLVAETVQHALAAGDYERAGNLIEQHGVWLAVRGQVHTVLSWLRALPEALTLTRAMLALTHAVILLLANHVQEAEARLQDAERGAQTTMLPEQVRIIQGRVAGTRASLVRFSGDLAQCVELSRQALELLPETEQFWRAPALVNAARAYLVSGDVTPAAEKLVAAMITPARASGSLFSYLAAVVNLARLHALQGRLRQTAATYAEAARVAPDGVQQLLNSAAYFFGLGDLLREWNDFDAAEHHMMQGLDLVRGTLIVDADVVLLGYVALARLLQARGDSDGAITALKTFAQLGRERNYLPLLIARGAAAQAQLALAQGTLQAAISWAEGCGLRPDDELSFPREAEYLTLARVLIAQGRQDPRGPYLRDALGLLDQLLDAAEASERFSSVIEIRILQALALQAQDDTSQALIVLEPALQRAAPEGYIRIFVDEGGPMAALLREAHQRGIVASYVEKLLAAFPEPDQETRREGDKETSRTSISPVSRSPSLPVSSSLVESLTTRELAVLRLLAAGASNAEIARELVVEQSTVKKHLIHIYGKLGAHSRTQAVAKARTLQLLD
jgi:LuxR family transcriptional regulator, maltose regulon positive regulatory protein